MEAVTAAVMLALQETGKLRPQGPEAEAAVELLKADVSQLASRLMLYRPLISVSHLPPNAKLMSASQQVPPFLQPAATAAQRVESPRKQAGFCSLILLLIGPSLDALFVAQCRLCLRV